MSNKYFKHMRTIQEIKVNAGAINDARFDEDYPLVKVRKARVRHNLPDAWNDIPRNRYRCWKNYRKFQHR